MNETFDPRRLRRPAILILFLTAAGCDDPSSVTVHLQARHAPGEPLTVLQIEAQVTGPLSGLSYRWFAVSGECDPQESDQPKTMFKFLQDMRQDKVSVEVSRNGNRVAQADLKVTFDERLLPRKEDVSEFQIEIDEIPPAEQGGPETRAQISGKVSANVPPSSLVLIYVKAYGSWFIQPIARSTHPLHGGNTWKSWTHTGSKYAAIVVRPEFEPFSTLDMLPEVGGPILAKVVVDGLSKVPGAPPPASGTPAPATTSQPTTAKPSPAIQAKDSAK